MANKFMTVSPETNDIQGSPIYESSETLSTPGNGDTILLPNQAGKNDQILVALIISSGSGKVQTTISPRADVIAGNANWIDWDSGQVSSTTTDTLFLVSAIRQVNVSGTTILEVRTV